MWMVLFVLSALFAALDQVNRFPERFREYIRLPEWVYFWKSGIKLPWPLDYPVSASKTYQGAKVWLISMAWWLAPSLPWYEYLLWMIVWWVVLRNVLLHKILTNDPHWPK